MAYDLYAKIAEEKLRATDYKIKEARTRRHYNVEK